MSATNRGAERRENDLYPTPWEVTCSLMDQLSDNWIERAKHLKWGEPCAGDWSIVHACNIHSGIPPKQWEWAELTQGRDYLVDGLTGPADVIVTNPPFLVAQEFIEKSLLDDPMFMSYLLRLNFLGSQKRHEWWQGREPTHLFTLSERPAFVSVCKQTGDRKSCGKTYPVGYSGKCSCGNNVGPGTDATEYAWFVWDFTAACKRPPGIYVI